ncbi:unnamed protein product [Rotaria sp. Silwood2]|nr:unnamed protein product [Rotaria sp. Silwood2]CAF2488105.1 unnamed protein product [Rotaria sp. Silwood2]CAF2744728.1 unnamed protein product [Rotaria sp. Silwood2]CAF2887816.1 unnamed protein product [Rotaria sp. Silwood2]CAF3863455.1 unnamed protein product [Rotaria sp. Silwood2]
MKKIFSHKETKTGQVTSSESSSSPAYYHHPSSSSSSTTDSYSHTANSTAGYSQRNAYPTLTQYNQEHEKKTLLEKTESFATNLLGNIVGEDTIVSATNTINNVITGGHNARDLLQNGAIVQLVSKSSGHLLQVVMSSYDTLVFDGNGTMNSFNTYFNVEKTEKGRLRFHNNYNYLAFDGKQACVKSFPSGAKNDPSVEFRVHDIFGTSELVAFESCTCKSHFISISTDGHLKTTNTKEKNVDAQFSVITVVNNQQSMFPYQAQPYQQFNMNPYGGFPPNSVNSSVLPHPSMYYQQPTAPPPHSVPSYAQNPCSQPSTSSGLYPKFN